MGTLHSLKELGTLLPPKKNPPKKTTAPIGNQLAAISKIMSKGKTFPDYDFNFGKWNGYSLEYVYKNDKNYLYWIISEENVVGPRIRKMIMDVLGVKE